MAPLAFIGSASELGSCPPGNDHTADVLLVNAVPVAATDR